MIRQFELVERVQSYDPDADEDVLNRAYVYGLKKHGTQLRASGDPYFSHPVEVAGILSDPRAAPMPARWRVLADFALVLTKRPSQLTEPDAQSLRGVGLGDQGLHDVVAITAYFNFVNRMAQGLHIPLESASGGPDAGG